jgi:hypothetical protein
VTQSIEDILGQASPRREIVRLSLRGDLAALHEQLEAELQGLVGRSDSLAADPRIADVAARIEDLEAEMRASEAEFTFRGIGRKAWTDLIGQHPPTDEQRKLLGRGIDHNPETFPAAAIAASLVEPAATPEQVARLEEALTVGQWDRLWRAALEVNVGADLPGESLAASAVLRRLRQSSEQPERMASPEASSLADA